MRILLPLAMILVLSAPAAADDRERIAALIEQLDSNSYKQREAASKALRKFGARSTEQLRAALGRATPEARARIRELLSYHGWMPPAERKRVEALLTQLRTGEPPGWTFHGDYRLRPQHKRLAAFNALVGMGRAAHFHLRRALRSSPKAKLAFKVTTTKAVVGPGEQYGLDAVLINQGPGGVWLRRTMPRSKGRWIPIRRRFVTVGKPGKGSDIIGAGGGG